MYWLGIGWWDLGLACAFLSCMSNLPAAFSSVVVWRLVWIACRSFFDLLCELLFDFPLPLGLIFIYRCALYSLRPISWLPSFPVILLCHSCHNDSILLGLFGLALLGPLVFLFMGYCVPFALFSLGHPWPVLLPLGFLILFTNSAFPWAITNFIGLPWPNYFVLILGVHGLAINPLLSLFALLLGLQWPILTFLHHILPMGMLFLSFWASLSPFASSRSIYLFHGLVIHYSCNLGLMVLPSVFQPFAALVAGLSSF